MSILYTLSAYCSDCGADVAESDSDDLDALAAAIEARVDAVYREHIATDCKH